MDYELKLNNLISLLQLIRWEKPQNHGCLEGRKLVECLRLEPLNSTTCSWAVENGAKIRCAERNLSQKEPRSRCAQHLLWLLAGLLLCQGVILAMLLHFIVEGWGKENALNGTNSGQETAVHTEMDIWAFLFPESQAHLICSSLLHPFIFIYTMKPQYLPHSERTLLKLVWFSIPGSKSWLLWIHSATCLFASLNYP